MRGLTHAKILSPSFHSVRKERLTQRPPLDPKTTKNAGGGGGTSRKIGWGCAACFLKPLPYFRSEALEPGVWLERITSCYGTYMVVGVNINPLSLDGDQHQFSPNNIHTSSREKVMRINKMITKKKCLDLLSNSLKIFFKKMYRDQFGEFVCGY